MVGLEKAYMWYSIIIPVIICFVGKLLSWGPYKLAPNLEKRSAYECGFSPFMSPRSSFSLYFFLISILFILFDVEVVVLLPLPLVWGASAGCMLSLGLFISVLVLGLYHEWREGSLEWCDF